MFDYKPNIDKKLINRCEIVFIVLAGLFLKPFAMLNMLGISRFIHFHINVSNLHIPVIFFVGNLPYPITFLCTDFISELYGKLRTNGGMDRIIAKYLGAVYSMARLNSSSGSRNWIAGRDRSRYRFLPYSKVNIWCNGSINICMPYCSVC